MGKANTVNLSNQTRGQLRGFKCRLFDSFGPPSCPPYAVAGFNLMQHDVVN